jgi:hypothetical protein
MPYIDTPARVSVETRLKANGTNHTPVNAGELNYIIFKLASNMVKDKKNYARCNEVIGALECSKAEFYRRIVAPYEDIKIEENGDVGNE